jgi:hypothetical protein
MEQQFDGRSEKVEQQVGHLDKKIDQQSDRLDKIEQQLGQLVPHVDQLARPKQ